MALFDSIISSASEKFGLGDKAGTMLSALLALMTNQETGGFSGFLDRFKEAGLGDTATSWVTSGDNAEISNEQVESAIGEETISTIAEQVGVDKDKTTAALAYMTPKVVDDLTPDGEVPDDEGLLASIGGFLSGIGGTAAGVVAGAAGVAGAAASGAADKAGDATDATVDAGKAAVGAVGDAAGAVGDKVGGAFESVGDVFDGDGDGDGGGVLKWLLPLILLGVLLALGFMFCDGGKNATDHSADGNKKSETNVKDENKDGDKPAAEAVDSSFKIEAKDGKYVVTGVVKDEETKKAIMEKLTAELGEGNVDFDGLKVDANATDFGPSWWDNFGKMLPNLKDWKTGVLAFVGNKVTQAEGLGDAANGQLKSLFGDGWILPASIAGAEETAKQANEQAKEDLEEAKSVDEIVKALNISIINFASGSSVIPGGEMEVIKKAAEVLKKIDAKEKIEIGGHTDSDGNDDSNQKLSQARADSVKTALVAEGVSEAMLVTKGYGEANPKVPNDSPDNKFTNRRIEYKVVGSDEAPTATTTETKPADDAKPAEEKPAANADAEKKE